MKKGLFQILMANIISLVIGVGLSFLVPKYLSIESYAAYKTYALYITYAGFFHFGYADGMYLKYGGKRIDEIDRQDLANNFCNYFTIILVMAAAFLGAGILIKDYVLVAFAVGQMTTNLLSYLRSLYQATGEFTAYSKALNFEKVGVFLLTIIFLLAVKSDSYLIYIGIQVLVGAFVSIYLLRKLENRLHFIRSGKLSLKECEENVRAGLVLMLGNFSSGVFTGLDRWFVKFLMESTSFALYSFSSSLLNLLNVFITPITVSLYNYFCKGIDNQKIQQLKRLILAWGLLLVSAAFPVKWILKYYLQKYYAAVEIVYVLFAAQVFIAVIQGVYVNLYKAKHLQRKYLIQMVLMLILGVVTNALFYIQDKRMEAFAYATLFTYLIWFLSCEASNAKLRYRLKDYVAMFVLFLAYFSFGMMFEPVIGLCLYVAVYVVTIRLFMPDVWNFAFDIVKSLHGKGTVKSK